MLTINYNGKTYKITGDNSEIEGVIRTAINNGVLDCIKCGEHAPCEYAETKEEPLIKDTIHNDCSGGLPSNDWCVGSYENGMASPEKPQFTPGQEIDHDQVKENIRVMDEQDGKIEPQLPEVPPIDFDQYMTWLEMAQKHQEVPYTVISILLAQAVAVNKFCQALSRQKPTK